jgi:hypothetical protein
LARATNQAAGAIPRRPVVGDRAEVVEVQLRLADPPAAAGNHAHRARADGVVAAAAVVGVVVAPAAVASAAEDGDRSVRGC